eukprot:3105766-Pyramimonas_sp.AAC.1
MTEELLVGGVRLKQWDRLEQSSDLPLIRDFGSEELPFRAVFWRSNYDERGRSTDWLTNRSPLFARSLG